MSSVAIIFFVHNTNNCIFLETRILTMNRDDTSLCCLYVPLPLKIVFNIIVLHVMEIIVSCPKVILKSTDLPLLHLCTPMFRKYLHIIFVVITMRWPVFYKSSLVPRSMIINGKRKKVLTALSKLTIDSL